jgi:hypothetical protein
MAETQSEMQKTQSEMQKALLEMLKTRTTILENIEGIREEQVALSKTYESDRLEMLKTQTAILKNIEETREEQMALRKKQVTLSKEQVALSKTHESDLRYALQVRNFYRDEDTLAAATKYKANIAKHFTRLRNMRLIRCVVLSSEELDDLLDNPADEQALSEFTDDELYYFSDVDLAFGVMRMGEKEPEFYIVVEASYTGSANDVARAVVRARILGAITGLDTYAVVASVHLGEGTEGRAVGNAKEYLDSADGNIAFWYEIVEEEVWPP